MLHAYRGFGAGTPQATMNAQDLTDTRARLSTTGAPSVRVPFKLALASDSGKPIDD